MYHYRAKKKKMVNKRVIILIIPLFVLTGLIYLFFCSSIFNIKAAEINGNEELNSEEIKNDLDYANIFLVSKTTIKNELLQKFPKIKDLNIKKNILKRELNITLSERKEIGIVCNAGRCFYVDEEGVIFENAPQTSGSLIVLVNDYSNREIKLGEKVFEQNLFDNLLEIKENLFQKIGLNVLYFDSMDFPVQNVKVMTNEKWYAFFNFNNNIKSQLSALKTALSEKIKSRAGLEYVDLRIENRIYYK